MRARFWLVGAAMVAAGCGSNGPSGPETPPPRTFDYITLSEYDGYLATLRVTFVGVNTMISEFGSIGVGLASGIVSDYWLSEFTKNLILRVEMLQRQATQIRPRHPELLKLHVEEYEAALTDFHAAFTLFGRGLANPGTVEIDDVNDLIVSGNVHLIRLQILLGDLGGRLVDLFEGLQTDPEL